MLGTVAKRLFGSANDRFIKSLRKTVEAINALEPQLEALSDAELRARTDGFRERLNEGAGLDDLLIEAFATVREASKRTLHQRHFDVQLMGGIVLHQGKIAEMKTGEGKTLVATLAVYLNALEGNGVHVVTVNDYLARRDAAWMGQIYQFLGLTVGCIVPGLDEASRKQAYAADITYGTNNELGFDYLRDNMKFTREAMVQRGFNFGIVDEVDSILIDEARTPLIISGPAEDSSELYRKVDSFIPRLSEEDYEKDEKQRAVSLTESGAEKMQKWLAEAEPAEAPGAVRHLERHPGPPRQSGAARAPAVHARRRLSGAQRQGGDRRRVHRPHDGGPALLRRPAPGARSQREGADPGREPDARLDHLPELLPALPQARRHDRHGRDRGLRVRRDLRARGRRDPDAHADDPRGSGRRGLPDRQGEVQGDRRQHRGCPRAWPARAGRHGQHREVRASLDAAQEGEDPAPGPERPLSRAGGVHRRPGGAFRRRDHRDQHGRARYRHPARRQSRDAQGAGARRTSRTRRSARRGLPGSSRKWPRRRRR